MFFEYKSCRQDALAKATMTIYRLIIQETIPATRIRGEFGFKKDMMETRLEKKVSTHSYEKASKYQVLATVVNIFGNDTNKLLEVKA